jgi:cobaltochelatase CobS
MHLTNADRATLRRLIAAHPDWPAYRRTHGVDTSSLGAARALEVARHLGIDTAHIANTQQIEDAETMPAPTAPTGLFNTAARPAAAVARPAAAVAPSVQSAMDALLAALSAQQGSGEALEALTSRVETLEAQAPRLLVVNEAGEAWGAELPPTRHPMLETLILTVAARDLAGHRINAWLAGPAGSGKTTAARMAADALGLTFGPMGAMSQAHELLGFVDANGTFHETPFTRAYRAGGVCLLDELDSADASITLLLNGPLDNGLLTLPTGEVIERHPDFVCIGAGNTWGNGATAEYMGRNRLDGAFLDRFAGLDWAYDEALETALAGNAAWSGRVQSARRRAAAAGLKVLITPRASIRGAALIRQGLDADAVARMTYLRGLTPAQICQVEAL